MSKTRREEMRRAKKEVMKLLRENPDLTDEEIQRRYPILSPHQITGIRGYLMRSTHPLPAEGPEPVGYPQAETKQKIYDVLEKPKLLLAMEDGYGKMVLKTSLTIEGIERAKRILDLEKERLEKEKVRARYANRLMERARGSK